MILASLASCQQTAPREFFPLAQTQEEEPDEEVEVELIRPDGAINFNINNNFCACQDGVSVLLNNCDSFCEDKNTNGEERLYFSFSVSDEITLNDQLQTVGGWCNNPYGESLVPNCTLEIRSEDGLESPITFDSASNTNSFTANISTLSYNKTYLITLIENETGASSDTTQIRKVSDNSSPTVSPLEITPIIQYSCIQRSTAIDEDTGDYYYESAMRFHFLFTEKTRPDPIPSTVATLFCHDINTYGTRDDSIYPRLEETPGTFSLWNLFDARFYDLDANGVNDIDEIIEQKVEEQGVSLSTTPELFVEFPAISISFDDEDSGNSNTGESLGFFMVPFRDENNLSFCPNSTHYYSSNAIFVALRDIIGTDTEAIYIAKRDPETITENGQEVQAQDDNIIVRETDIKKVWFYFNNGVPTEPTNDNTLRNKKIYFYYPYDFNNPYIKKSTQRTYSIISASDASTQTGETGLNSGTSSSSGSRTEYPAHDNRIGCVPKSGD